MVANCMVSQGRIQDFLMGVEGGGNYNNRPSNYTLIYFKLSYVCPKTRRFRKDEGWLASQGFCDPRISIFFGPTYFRLFFHVIYFSVSCSTGAVASHPIHPHWIRPCFLLLLLRPIFMKPKQNMLD